MSFPKKMPFVVAFWIFSSCLHGQDVVVELQLIRPNAQIFSTGEFNFTGNDLATDYFFVRIRNQGRQTLRLYLNLRIAFNDTRVVEGNTTEFNLPADNLEYLLSSLELILGLPTTINGQTIKLTFSDIDWGAVPELEDRITNTGRLPAGIYRLIITAIVVAPEPAEYEDSSDDENHTLFITNPTTLQLFFPGSSISESQIPEISTVFPYFQWQTDVNPLDAEYNVFVYEKSDDDKTVQDVLNQPPIFHLQGYKDSFFQYPSNTDPLFSSGVIVGPVRLLEAGKTYYWKIESVIISGTGTVTIESDIYRFRITDLRSDSMNAKLILVILQQMLGTQYDLVVQELVEKGFEPNGKILFEGNRIPITELIQFLNEISQGKATVQKLEIY